MAEDDVTEEARRVIDALDQVEEMEDPIERAVAASEVLADYKERAPQMRELQRQAIEMMRAEDPPVSYRKIAARLKISLGAVQNIERGHGSAWGTKPRKKTAEE
jgi:DNA-directed RNA polymerase specialized sigma24 family protein